MRMPLKFVGSQRLRWGGRGGTEAGLSSISQERTLAKAHCPRIQPGQ
jgi:hypothetical protein